MQKTDILQFLKTIRDILIGIEYSKNENLKDMYIELFYDLISFYANLDIKTKHKICFLLLDSDLISDNEKDNLYHMFYINLNL